MKGFIPNLQVCRKSELSTQKYIKFVELGVLQGKDIDKCNCEKCKKED